MSVEKNTHFYVQFTSFGYVMGVIYRFYFLNKDILLATINQQLIDKTC
jgi:hypothetical protein